MAAEEYTTLAEPKFHVILTERLRLRTFQLSDATKVLPLIGLEAVMRWTTSPPIYTLVEAERWVSERALGANVFNFAIELRDDESKPEADRPIVGIAGSFRTAEVGYMIHSAYSGKGYATEAIQAIIPQLFDRIPPLNEGGSDHIEGWTDIRNWPSRRILEKCGFTHCDTVPDTDKSQRHPSQMVIFRKARPGRTLEDLGLAPVGDVDPEPPAPEPPVQ